MFLAIIERVIEAETYFSFENFSHQALWRKGEPVWSALLELENYFLKKHFKIEIELDSNIHLINRDQIAIGEGTIIEPGVMIKGPCIIGKNCTIRHGAYLREHLILGDEVQIGHSAELKHSILFDKAKATHFTYVGDSILGEEVNLGAGVKCANLRLDRKEVSVSLNGKKWKTGLKKFGAIVGDRTQIGCNCVLNPGLMIGKESFSHPLMNLKGIIPSRSLVDGTGVRAAHQKNFR